MYVKEAFLNGKKYYARDWMIVIAMKTIGYEEGRK